MLRLPHSLPRLAGRQVVGWLQAHCRGAPLPQPGCQLRILRLPVAAGTAGGRVTLIGAALTQSTPNGRAVQRRCRCVHTIQALTGCTASLDTAATGLPAGRTRSRHDAAPHSY